MAGPHHVSLRAHCFWELIFRGERGLFVCRVKETVAAVPKQLMARVLVLSLSHSHWGRAPDGLAWPQAPGQGLLWWPAPGVTSLLPPASPPRSVALDCTHICSIDYTVVLGLGELLEDFHKRGATLALIGLQVGIGTCSGSSLVRAVLSPSPCQDEATEAQRS